MRGLGDRLAAGTAFADQQQRHVVVEHAPELVDRGLQPAVAGGQPCQAGTLRTTWAGRADRRRRVVGARRLARRRRLHGVRGHPVQRRRPVEAGRAEEVVAVGQPQVQRHGHRAAEMVDHLRRRQAEQRLQRLVAQGHAGDAELVERALVGADDAAVGADDEDALHQRADELDLAVEVQAQAVAAGVAEPVVLDHAGRHAHQAHRVAVVGAVVARDVEHAEDVAARVEDGRGRAGEEAVGVHEVLVGMHERGPLLEEGGAHRVGALALLGPVDAGREGDLGGALEEAVVAHRMQHGALGVAQHDHALGAGDVAEQHLHHRRGVVAQALGALAGDAEVAAQDAAVFGRVDPGQPERGAAVVRIADRLLVVCVAHGRQRRLGRVVPDSDSGVSHGGLVGAGGGGPRCGPQARGRGARPHREDAPGALCRRRKHRLRALVREARECPEEGRDPASLPRSRGHAGGEW
jgi:hypothetical protein